MNFKPSDLSMTFQQFCAMPNEDRQALFELHHSLNKAKIDATLSEKVWAVFVDGIEDPIASNEDIFTYPHDHELTALATRHNRPVFTYTANLPIESL